MILYKYMSNSDYTLDCLSKNYLYGATPAELNDPFELWFVHSIFESKWEQIKEYIKQRAKKTGIPYENLKQHYNHIGRKRFLEEIKGNYDELNAKVRLVCLSANPNSLLMWSHYANHHKGLLLKIDFRDTEAIYKIKYSDKTPSFNPILRTLKGNFENVFLTKHTDWSYESESRIVIQNGYQYLLKKARIEEIVFGVRSQKKFIDEVQKAVNGQKVAFRSAKKVPGHYRLEYE